MSKTSMYKRRVIVDQRDTKTVKIVILWLLVVIAITEVAIMVDVRDYIVRDEIGENYD
jgi:hypothetical protein